MRPALPRCFTFVSAILKIKNICPILRRGQVLYPRAGKHWDERDFKFLGFYVKLRVCAELVRLSRCFYPAPLLHHVSHLEIGKGK